MTASVRGPLVAVLGGLATASLVVACSLSSDLDGLGGGRPADASDGSAPPDAAVADGGQGVVQDAQAASPYAAAVLADSPLAYWRLGEASGTVAHDETRLHEGLYTGTVALGTPGAILGDPDTAAAFDGTSTRVFVGNALAFAGSASYTLEAWVKPLQIGGEQRIISRRTSDANNDGYRLMFTADASFVTDREVTGKIVGSAAAPAPPIGTFCHLVATYDGSALRLYVNGALASSGDAAAPLVDATTDFVIGSTSSGRDSFFRGVLDEIAVYGSALSAERVAVHYHAAGR